MPYVITTMRTVHGDVVRGGSTTIIANRLAVATLEKARALLREAIIGCAHPDVAPRLSLSTTECLMYHGTISSLHKTGGTIGLPDGTRVEVERVEWRALWEPTGMKGALKTKIIDAYNEREDR